MYLGALLADGGSDPSDLSGRRGRIFEQLRINLNHHPATETVVVRPTRDQKDRKLVARFDMQILVDGLVDADEARLEINWWTHPDGIGDQFKFHYVESSGYDCGWHRQPHPEESDIPFDHFQQRASPESDYQYQGVDFLEKTPVGLLWEVTRTRLPRIIRARYDPDTEF
ncbi:hypothetical protein CP557_02410 [Natrinema ejinorense]|uniref:Uncharacterized protein n=2 Tax=Natrinema ejinorense TaxID=373386 RepID=A0A2A5QRL9_9EURY|nr:hypothetical protein CP557_02410 [Natrinema ejinorense]